MKKLGLLVMPLMAVSLLASCNNSDVKYCIVYFDVNDGTPEVERQVVKEGTHAKEPQVSITRGDEILKFWSLNDEDEDNPTPFSFTSTKITSDLLLHAIYGRQPTPPAPSPDTQFNFKCLSDTASLAIAETTSFSLEYYNNDYKSWENVKFDEMEEGVYVSVFSLKKDQTIYFRGDNPNGFNGGLIFCNASNGQDGELSVNGDIMSLLQKNNYSTMTSIPEVCFEELFNGNENLVDASNLLLPSFVSDSCYHRMFDGCHSLIYAPALPAMSLAKSCYGTMFRYCTSLSVPPILPANIFADDCYENMFYDDGKLNISNTEGAGYIPFFTCPDEPEKYAPDMFHNNQVVGDTPEAGLTYYYTFGE